ncbi:hypothetical protein PROFUN_07217 [Planoprotostelium fungivorum]|uniref:Uncharacterized protein n=1 Tax=Planoprotostelium fungivorum TaxID=1890364 RepID=A0A2P6NMF8_9EUKA|nr:hypothetical protein PROFUN_07217 [Planoprotostelium fungivorum]
MCQVRRSKQYLSGKSQVEAMLEAISVIIDTSICPLVFMLHKPSSRSRIVFPQMDFKYCRPPEGGEFCRWKSFVDSFR